MSRKTKLTPEQKRQIAYAIEGKTYTVTELANQHSCHPRTIYRALEEQGMGTAQTSRKLAKKSAGSQALEIMAKYGVSVEQLGSVLAQATTFTLPRKPQPAPAPSRTAALFHPVPSVGLN